MWELLNLRRRGPFLHSSRQIKHPETDIVNATILARPHQAATRQRLAGNGGSLDTAPSA
ncbi:hypothetical protein CBM2585_A90003 [Cupriavidus taiwanensis]|nr:hypothetical protein CBM2585_A90003 [Cupriavidus taiwanensis]